jgi:succinate-semialdehyde dehydrogenase / glutarate-semialdehyde dehydrogenase
MNTQTPNPEFRTLNPSTGEVVAAFQSMSDTEAFTALSVAEECYQTDWRLRPIADRARLVRRAAEILRERSEEYAQYVTLEMGKLIDGARNEVGLAADILAYYADHAEHFLKARPLPEAPGSVIVMDPIGVILAIEPWNLPYYQLARVVGPQLVAGNVVMVKHAPSVPQCALAFARLFEEAGAPTGAYTNLFVSTDQIGNLIEDQRVRGVTLTGSERAGSSVAERAGKTLKKTVLELGGSDPFIVLEDAPLADAIEAAYQGRMRNMGQSCIASKRIVVVGKARGEQFLAGFKERMSKFTAGDPADSRTTLGPVVSEQALNGLLHQIEQAKAHGADVVLGGKRLDRPGFYLEPTIITGITADNPLYQQETFGPVASFYVVESEEEAIRLANATGFGLGATVFTADLDHAEKLARRIDSGMVFINGLVRSRPEVPFGGVKNSGYGRELSELGIGEFMNRKLIQIPQSA